MRESWVAAGVAAKLENVGRILDHVNVDIPTLTRIHSGARVHRVLVLRDLRNGIKVVCAHLVTTKVVNVEKVRLSALSSHLHAMSVS